MEYEKRTVQKGQAARNPGTADPFDTLYQRAKQLPRHGIEFEQQRPPVSYRVVGRRVTERGQVASRTKFYYNFGVCKEDGELFGINYQCLCKATTPQRHVNWFHIALRQGHKRTVQFQHGPEPGITCMPAPDAADVEYLLRQYNAVVPASPPPSAAGGQYINVVQCQLEEYLRLSAYNLHGTRLERQNAIPALKQVIQYQRQLVPQAVLKAQSNSADHPNANALQPKTETYDEKFIYASNYKPNYNIIELAGFRKNSTPQQFEDAKRLCPSLCHFLIFLLANQDVCNCLGEQETFYATKPPELIYKHRQSMLVKHILIAVKDHFPRVLEFVPAGISPFEAVLTALNTMVSPGRFQLQNSLFDEKGGDVQSYDTAPFENILFIDALTEVQKKYAGCTESATQFDKNQYLHSLNMEKQRRRQEMQKQVNTRAEYPGEHVHHGKYGAGAGAMHQQQQQLLLQIRKAKNSVNTNILTGAAGASLPQTNMQTSVSQQLNQLFPTQQEQHAEHREQLTALLQHISSIKTTKQLSEYEFGQIFGAGRPHVQRGTLQRLVELVTCNDGVELYVSQNQLVVIDRRSGAVELNALKFGAEELARAQIGQLFSGRATGEDADGGMGGDESCERVGQPLELPVDELEGSMAVLDITSPMLGEYELRRAGGVVRYCGVNAAWLGAAARLVAALLALAAREVAAARAGGGEGVPDSEAARARLAVLQASKLKVVQTVAPAPALLRYAFRAQERMRFFLFPHCFYVYCGAGRRAFVGKVYKSDGKTKALQNAFRLAADYRQQVPAQVTKFQLVLEAAARLPGRFGTREDICHYVAASHFVNPLDPKFVSKISCALDRMKTSRIASFDPQLRIWRFRDERARCLADQHYPDWPRDLYEIYERASRPAE